MVHRHRRSHPHRHTQRLIDCLRPRRPPRRRHWRRRKLRPPRSPPRAAARPTPTEARTPRAAEPGPAAAEVSGNTAGSTPAAITRLIGSQPALPASLTAETRRVAPIGPRAAASPIGRRAQRSPEAAAALVGAIGPQAAAGPARAGYPGRAARGAVVPQQHRVQRQLALVEDRPAHPRAAAAAHTAVAALLPPAAQRQVLQREAPPAGRGDAGQVRRIDAHIEKAQPRGARGHGQRHPRAQPRIGRARGVQLRAVDGDRAGDGRQRVGAVPPVVGGVEAERLAVERLGEDDGVGARAGVLAVAAGGGLRAGVGRGLRATCKLGAGQVGRGVGQIGRMDRLGQGAGSRRRVHVALSDGDRPGLG